MSWPSFCRHLTVVSTHIENASVIPMELLEGFPSTRTQTIYAMSIVKLQEKILTPQLYPFLGVRSRKMSHLPSGNLTYLLNMAIYSGFSHWKWWFSIAMLNYQRVFCKKRNSPGTSLGPSLPPQMPMLRRAQAPSCPDGRWSTWEETTTGDGTRIETSSRYTLW